MVLRLDREPNSAAMKAALLAHTRATAVRELHLAVGPRRLKAGPWRVRAPLALLRAPNGRPQPSDVMLAPAPELVARAAGSAAAVRKGASAQPRAPRALDAGGTLARLAPTLAVPQTRVAPGEMVGPPPSPRSIVHAPVPLLATKVLLPAVRTVAGPSAPIRGGARIRAWLEIPIGQPNAP